MHLAEFSLGLSDEMRDSLSWIEGVLTESPDGTGKRFASLAVPLLLQLLVEEADLTTVRALRDRLEYGDSISIGVVNSLIKFTGNDTNILGASIRCAPLTYYPMTPETEIRHAVKGLDFYPDLYDELNGEFWRENSKLLIEATLHIFDNFGIDGLMTIHFDDREFWDYFTLPSSELAALFLERRHQYDEILDIIGSRRTVDTELIVSILEADAKALSSGSL